MKTRILGARYELSVGTVSPSAMQRLNRTYRGADEPTDVLAFPFDRTHGEVLFSLPVVSKKARAFGMRPRDYYAFLFIHALLHLKGHTHGRIMERLEDRWCRVFGTPLLNRDGTRDRSRDRRRHPPGARRRRAR